MRQRALLFSVSAALVWVSALFYGVSPQPGIASAVPLRLERNGTSRPITYQGAGLWSAPLQVSEGSASAANPALVVDTLGGLLHLVWEENAGIRYAYRDASGWRLDPNSLPGDSPALDIDRDGVAHLVYVDPEGDIRHTLRGPKGWQPPANISRTSGQSIHPDLALTAQGIHVLWTEQIDDAYRVYHAQSLDNGLNWYAMQAIPRASGYAVSLASTPEGHLRAAWQYRAAVADSPMRIYSAAYDGTVWTEPVAVSLGLAGEARDPNLAVDGAGHAHLVWEQDTDAGASSVYYVQDSPGAWMTPILLSSRDDEARYPCLTLGPLGDAYVAWNGGQVLLHRRQNGGIWQEPEPVVNIQGSIRQAALAAGSDGVTYAAWSARGDSGVWSLYFSERSPGELPVAFPSPIATTNAATPPASPTPDAFASPTRLAANRSLVPSFLVGEVPSLISAVGSALANVLPQAQPTWSAPINIASSAKDSRKVALARGLDGTVYAVWEERNYWGSTTFLMFSRLLNGSWTVPKASYAGEDPSLAVSPDGGIHLVYTNEHDGNDEISYSTWITESWSASVPVSNTSGRSIEPAVAIAGDGRPVVVWSETLGTQTSIYFGRQNGGFWSTYPVDNSSGGRVPDVAVERDGRIWVAWQALEEERHNIYAIEGDGESWGLYAYEISDGTAADSTDVEMVGIPSLGAFAVWRGLNTAGSQIYYTHNLWGVDYWEWPVNVSQATGAAFSPALAIDAAGNMHLAWSEATQLRYRQATASEQTWTAASSIASQAPGLGPSVLVAAAGPQVHAAWDQAVSADQHDIYYRAASAPTPSATPSPTPSRTPTPTRAITPLPRRLWLPSIMKP